MWVFAIVASCAGLMMAMEYGRPGRRWPRVAGWWLRAAALNAVQVALVFVAGVSWDGWMQAHRAWSADGLGPVAGAVIGYVAITFVYYWWHRARHRVPRLWRWLHQVHHSPRRIEIITSFYKHPLEIVANGILSSAILYLGVGVGPEAASGAVMLTGIGELIYHWNVATPRWMGYFVQRPEMHCVHHQHEVHAYNYSDLPLWDMLFGTFYNPGRFEQQCGLGAFNEHRLSEMLRGIDVTAKPRDERA